MALMVLLISGLAWLGQAQNTMPEQVIRNDLDRQGLRALSMTVAGRDVHLSGMLPRDTTPDFALSLAQGASCRFWFVTRQCANRVTGDFAAPAAPAADAIPTALADLAPTTAGAAPTEREAPMTLAATADVPAAGMSASVSAATRAAAASPPDAAAADTVAGPAASPPAPDALDTHACQAALGRTLVQGPALQFRIADAELVPGAGATLDRLVAVLGRCPGSVRIEGHTDNRGNEARNRTLSQARASSIRAALIARGADGRRLQAAGVGAARPRFDNETADGRRANRRIEFVVDSAR